MGWYKRLIFDGFRRFNWKSHCAVGSFSKSVKFFSSRSKAKPGGSIISQPILSISNVLKNQNNRISNAKRFHTKLESQPILRNFVLKNHNNRINNPNVKSFYSKLRCRRWYQNPLNLGLGCGVVISVYYWNLEMVPYSKRKHFVIMSSSVEKKIGDCLESSVALCYKGKILGSDHPDSIRVEKVGRKIIEGLRNRFCNRLEDGDDRGRLIALVDKYNWDFVVVDEPTDYSAFCLFAGKIVISTGMLHNLDNDDEIAVVLSHEVGHAVARHQAESTSNITWWLLLPFQRHPIRRRHELEADYIGFLISASAGYDPWKMLKAYRKLFLASDMHRNLEVSSTHPSGKTRVEQVSQTRVMEEALAIYKEALKDEDKDSMLTSIFNKLTGLF